MVHVCDNADIQNVHDGINKIITRLMEWCSSLVKSLSHKQTEYKAVVIAKHQDISGEEINSVCVSSCLSYH